MGSGPATSNVSSKAHSLKYARNAAWYCFSHFNDARLRAFFWDARAVQLGPLRTLSKCARLLGETMVRTLTCQRIIRSFACFVLLAVLATMAGLAQTRPVVGSLVAQPINEGSLVILTGNPLPAAQPQFDRGPAPDSMPAERLMLILKRSPQQEAELQSYLQSVQDPDSPDFRRFLSPDEFGQRYGLSDADLAKLQTWLQSHGFSVSNVNQGRTAIEFSGTV